MTRRNCVPRFSMALAHGFKTPLTAIKTASSGLLAIDHLSSTQLELVAIIDERVTMLSQLTTRLLQTAALEAKEVRLRRSDTSHCRPGFEGRASAGRTGPRSDRDNSPRQPAKRSSGRSDDRTGCAATG